MTCLLCLLKNSHYTWQEGTSSPTIFFLCFLKEAWYKLKYANEMQIKAWFVHYAPSSTWRGTGLFLAKSRLPRTDHMDFTSKQTVVCGGSKVLPAVYLPPLQGKLKAGARVCLVENSAMLLQSP
jgi:hypothetical protein